MKTASYDLCGQRPPGLYDQNFVHTEDFVQESLCGEQLPAGRDQQPPDFAFTEPFTGTCT